jgi:hypothetical protein
LGQFIDYGSWRSNLQQHAGQQVRGGAGFWCGQDYSQCYFFNHLPRCRRFQRNRTNLIRTNMLVTTTKGDMDDSLLEKRDGTVDNDNELTTWVEYWLEGELVHRSAHVTLKKTAVFGGGETASFA